MREIIFLVEEDSLDGGYVAQAIGESIFTQADNWESLKEQLKDAVICHFTQESERPETIRFYLIRLSEVVSV